MRRTIWSKRAQTEWRVVMWPSSRNASQLPLFSYLLLCYCRTEVNATQEIKSYTHTNFSTVTLHFHLRRNPLYYVINLIIPCGLLSLIAVATFILEPACQHRMGLGELVFCYFVWDKTCTHKN